MYLFFLDKIRLPIAPSEMEVTIGSNNETIDLIGGQINILKEAPLTEISFKALLPNYKYPFAHYENGFEKPNYFLDVFEAMKKSKKPFQFIVNRMDQFGWAMYYTNTKVVLEEYKIKESAEDLGFDVEVEFTLKTYRDYCTKKLAVAPSTNTVQTETPRPAPNPPTTKKYIVKSGDCLWNIAKYFYGDGSKWPTIHKANSWIKNPNLIYPGQELIIP